MLIFIRRTGQGGYIGDDVFFTVLHTKGNQVRLGFEAPPSVTIDREEIYERIKRELEEED